MPIPTPTTDEKGNADLSYLAGFFDGEGSISIRRYKHRETIGWELDCRVTTAGNYLPQTFATYFGGVVTKGKESKNYQIWTWRILAREAFGFLVRILPYLKLKKPQAEVAITFQEVVTKNNHKTGARGLSEGEKAFRESKRMLLKALKIKSYSTN